MRSCEFRKRRRLQQVKSEKDHRCGDQLSQAITDHPALDISQPKVTATMAKGPLFVIQSRQVQNSCMKVMDMDLIFCHIKTELVGFAVTYAAPDAAAG